MRLKLDTRGKKSAEKEKNDLNANTCRLHLIHFFFFKTAAGDCTLENTWISYKKKAVLTSMNKHSFYTIKSPFSPRSTMSFVIWPVVSAVGGVGCSVVHLLFCLSSPSLSHCLSCLLTSFRCLFVDQNGSGLPRKWAVTQAKVQSVGEPLFKFQIQTGQYY